MLTWIEKYRKASAQTKFFILNWLLYGLLIVGSTLFCYGRLDFVRSYKTEPPPAATQYSAQNSK